MSDLSLSCRFRQQLEDAVFFWKEGNKQAMLTLIDELWETAFDDGRAYMAERATVFLEEEMKGGGVRDDGNWIK